METVGEKITEIRKRKGLTQEVLADKAKINLRTLQRIEKSETEPRGHTLRALCEVLEIGVEDILDYRKKEDKKFLIYFHLSVVFGLFIPLVDVIIPMILWLTNKDNIIFLKEQGINVLNFRIFWTILYCLFFVGFMFSRFMFGGFNRFMIFELILIINVLVTFVYPVYVAISISINKTNKIRSYYPNWIKIIR